MNVTLRQLHYVRTAASCRSIAGAAETLRISPSSIATAIDRVEDEFGIRVFVRQPSQGLTPTRPGRQLLQRIGGLLTDVDNFASDAFGLKSTLSGELTLGCFAPLSPLFLPSILRDLTQRHQDISVHLHEADLREVQEYLLEGTTDVILSYDLGISDRIHSEPLGEASPHVVLSEDDPLGRKKAISLAELRDKPMVLLDLPESRTYFDLLFESIGDRPRIAHRTKTYEMVRGLVAAGLGFSLLNTRPLTNETYGGAKVICRPLEDTVRAPKFIIGRRREDFPIRLVEAFSDSCRRYFESDRAARHIVTL